MTKIMKQLTVSPMFNNIIGKRVVELWNKVYEINNKVETPIVIPVLTEYPTTTPSKAGTRFWYKGNEWHYMTQAEIDSCEWTGLVEVGFPAPVRKCFDAYILTSHTIKRILAVTGADPINNTNLVTSNIVDWLGLGFPNLIKTISNNNTIVTGSLFPNTITGFRNCNLLNNLEDAGTFAALHFGNSVFGMTDSVINSLFTQLPATVKTATINVTGNPGAATCTPSIATAKGYTVVTT